MKPKTKPSASASGCRVGFKPEKSITDLLSGMEDEPRAYA